MVNRLIQTDVKSRQIKFNQNKHSKLLGADPRIPGLNLALP